MFMFFNIVFFLHTLATIIVVFYTKVSKEIKSMMGIGFIILLSIGIDISDKELKSLGLTCTDVKIKKESFRLCLGQTVSCSIYNDKMMECVER